jgi:SAM-dependent methyltransferase
LRFDSVPGALARDDLESMTSTTGAPTGLSDRLHHPIFARLYARLAFSAEAAGAAEHRDELLLGLHGRIAEIGAGSGTNFAHYPSEVREVLAFEPEPYLRRCAAVARSNVPVGVVAASATALPIAAGSCDAVVFSLVLCTVASPAAALAEAARVLVEGGELRFYEHVRASDLRAAHRQDQIDRIWSHVAGGCHCNRDTVSTITAAGFTVTEIRQFDFRPRGVSLPVTPHVIGTAIVLAS